MDVLPAPPGIKWPGLRQIVRLNRVRIFPKTQKRERKVHYYLVSLPPSQTTPKQLLKMIRGHWGIENNLHRNRDMLMKEDAATVRTKNAPQVLAACRNSALSKLKAIHTSPTIAREIATHKPTIAINQMIKP